MLFTACGGGGGGSDTPSAKSCNVQSHAKDDASYTGFYDVASTDCEFFATAKYSDGTIIGYAVSTPQNPNLAQVPSYDAQYSNYCKVDFLVFTEVGGWRGYFTNSECVINDRDVYDGDEPDRCYYVYKNENKEVACN
ncbi:MAG: hypothetical protein LBJ88_03375 [Campylobacteraceae bacterium]|jgi:hypothetical protein|nr:hypothetical protein [Campylobacteraceae bacterium]